MTVMPSVIPDQREGLPRFHLGQGVLARASGDYGVVERVIRQRYAENLYVVVWHQDADDLDMYPESSLVEVPRLEMAA